MTQSLNYYSQDNITKVCWLPYCRQTLFGFKNGPINVFQSSTNTIKGFRGRMLCTNTMQAHRMQAQPTLAHTATMPKIHSEGEHRLLPRSQSLQLWRGRGLLWRRPPWAPGRGAGPSTGVSRRHYGEHTGWTRAFWALYMLHNNASGVTEGLLCHPATAYLKQKKKIQLKTFWFIFLNNNNTKYDFELEV